MSDTPTEGADAPEVNPPDQSAPTTEPPGDDPAKLLAQLRNEATKERKARQALERQLSEVQAAQMTDQERAVAEAEARGRLAASTEYATNLAAAKIEARLAGVVPDVNAVLEFLDVSKFVLEDGTVDVDKIEALRERYAAIVPQQMATPSVPTGPRGGEASSWTLERVQRLSKTNPEQVEAARQRGELDHLLRA